MKLLASLLLATAALAACDDPDVPVAPPGVEEAIALGGGAPGMIAYRTGQFGLEVRSPDGTLLGSYPGGFGTVITRGTEPVIVQRSQDTSEALVLDAKGQVARRFPAQLGAAYLPAGTGFLELTGGEREPRVRRLDAELRPIGPAIDAEQLVAAREDDLLVIRTRDDRRLAVRYDREGRYLEQIFLSDHVTAVIPGDDGYLLFSHDGGDTVRASVLRGGARTTPIDLGRAAAVAAAPGVFEFEGVPGWALVTLEESGALTLSLITHRGRAGYARHTVMQPDGAPLGKPSIANVDGQFLVAAVADQADAASGQHEVTVRAVTVDLVDGPGPVTDVAVSRW